MSILVDTSVWSLAFRRTTPSLNPYLKELTELIGELKVSLIGPIRQEILSGIKEESQFTILKNRLRAFEDLPITLKDYELAAEFFNICRSNGIQGSNTDFLICAISKSNNTPVLTLDKDFLLFKKYIPIKLHNPR